MPVIAGTGSNSTAEAIELTQHAKKAGADAAMLVVPYYNKPTQEGLFQHFKAVAEAVDIPILLYNVPPRTGGDMQVETVIRLSPGQEHRRHQGRELRHGAPDADPAQGQEGLRPALGRGCERAAASWRRAATAASR